MIVKNLFSNFSYCSDPAVLCLIPKVCMLQEQYADYNAARSLPPHPLTSGLHVFKAETFLLKMQLLTITMIPILYNTPVPTLD